MHETVTVEGEDSESTQATQVSRRDATVDTLALDQPEPDQTQATRPDSPSSVTESSERSSERTPAEPRPRESARIGRFVILHKLGQGAMGVVFAAYDDQLDRKVAIKLLRSRTNSTRERARLLREAQGLARLSDPHVVQIHEIGEYQGAVFVAMEFVAGSTLRDWIAQPHPWPEILAVMIQAGRGLAAAHEAGMVHRDFKPDNAMIGDDGRVRVLDFGLVRGLDSEDAPAPSESAAETLESGGGSEPTSLLDHTLTRTGTLLGTPAYMAPEQLDLEVVGPATDQFAFCVATFEALYGMRPFAGDSFASLSANVLGGRMIDRPADTQVPQRIHDAIVRGLTSAPDQRWPSMSALLAELEAALAPPASRQHRWLTWLAGASALGSLVAALVIGSREPELAALCELDDAPFVEIWDDARRTQLHETIARAAPEFADAALGVVDRQLDDWTGAWLDARRQACVETRIQAIASDQLLDRRVACLERQRSELAGLVDTLATADAALVEHLPELLAGLPDLSRCQRPGAEVELPEDPAQARAVLDGFELLAQGRARLTTGAFDEVRALAESAARIGERSDHLPLSLGARVLEAELSLALLHYDEGVEQMQAVIRDASAHQLDELIASARAKLAAKLVGRWSVPRAEVLLVDELEASLGRLEQPPWTLEEALLEARVELASSRGDYERALELHAQARALRAANGGLDTVKSLVIEADLVERLGHIDESRAKMTRALELARERWGPASPLATHLELDLAVIAAQIGDDDSAEAHLELARPRLEQLYGPDSLDLARARFVAAKLAMNRGQLEAAAAELRRVIEVFERELGPRSEDTGQALTALGVLRFYLDDHVGAIEAYERARDIAIAVHGHKHEEVALLGSNIGESQTALGDHAAALESYADALACYAELAPDSHPDTAYPLKGRGKSLLALGRAAEAVTSLEAALALFEAQGIDAFELADTRLALARALLESEGASERGRSLARAAAEGFASIGNDEQAEAARAIAGH